MNCRSILLILFIFAIGPVAIAQNLSADDKLLLFKLQDFSVEDQSGRLHQLSRKINSKYIVFYSYMIGCPIGRKNIPKLAKLSKKLEKKGVSFYFLDSASQDDREKVGEEHKQYAVPFPILIDDTQEIARMLKINRSGEAVVIDMKSLKIVFRGPVDDQQSYAIDKERSSKNYLSDALDNLLKKKLIKTPVVNALGCALTFRPRREVTYYKDVAPIFRTNCAYCHVVREVPPTNMFSYDNARNWSAMIKEVIQTDLMPPWEVDNSTKVKNQFKLTAEEKETIYTWIETGMKEGNAEEKEVLLKNKNAKRVEPEFNKTLEQKEILHLKAGSDQLYYRELLEINQDNDYMINTFKMHSDLSNQSMIQHSALIVTNGPIDISGKSYIPFANFLDKVYTIITLSNKNGLLSEHGGVYAYKIPKGAYIYLENHFVKTGKDESIKFKMHMKKYTDKGNLKEIHYSPMASLRKFTIPPNKENFILKTNFKFDEEVKLFRLGAHMHLRGSFAKVFVKENESSSPKLFFSSRYIFKNRKVYELNEPIVIKPGAILDVVMEYDNSPANPARIAYTKKVHLGEDADKDEMMLMHLYYFKD